MGKASTPRALADTEAKAVMRNIRISPQKLNLVAQLIRGKKVAAALADLEFSQKRIADDVKKTLESAIANAENNHSLDVDDLVVAQAVLARIGSSRVRGAAALTGQTQRPALLATAVKAHEQVIAAVDEAVRAADTASGT